jgi:hypothetical protein
VVQDGGKITIDDKNGCSGPFLSTIGWPIAFGDFGLAK